MSVVSEEHDSLRWFLHAPALPLKLWPLLRDMRLSLADVFDDLFDGDELPKLALAANLGYYADDPARLWWAFYAVAQGGFLASGGTFIKGGSAALSRGLTSVVAAEGGTARAGRTVTEILLDDAGRAAGVVHTATDGGDRASALADYGDSAEILADAPSSRMPVVGIVNYDTIDSGLNLVAPYLVSITGVDRVVNWDGLDEQAYRAKRDAWLETIVDGIDRSFPGFAGRVVQREMATAATMRNYLNTPDGAVYGFAPDPPRRRPEAGSEKAIATTIPGLWLTSSYGGVGGFTGVMLTGMMAAQAATKQQRLDRFARA